MKPTVSLFLRRGLPPDVRREVRSIVRRLGVVSPATRPVDVHVYPARMLTDHIKPGRLSFGLFVAGRYRARPWAAIHLATGPLKGLARRFMVGEVLLHEWAHYEQWRDGRRMQERGVAVRARTLRKLINEVS